MVDQLEREDSSALLAILSDIIDHDRLLRICAARTVETPRLPGRRLRLCDDFRLTLVLQGQHRMLGPAEDAIPDWLSAGTALVTLPGSWSLALHDHAFNVFGLVFLPHCLRFVHAVFDDAGQQVVRRYVHSPDPPNGLPLQMSEAVTAALRQREDGRALQFLRACLAASLAVLAAGPGGQSKGQRTWLAVQTYIEEHYGDALSRTLVAKALDLHPNHLSRLCQQFGGESFTSLVSGVRMRHALRFCQAGWSDAEIASNCGFDAVVYFRRVFRQHYDCTPAEYRRRHGIA